MHTAGTLLLDGEGSNRRVYFSLFTVATFSASSFRAKPEKEARTGHQGTIHPLATSVPRYVRLLPSTVAFTRPGSNIVAKFVFINVQAIAELVQI